MPKVSVVMNCHNGASFLREAIDSVYVQTYPDWEIVFWDNLSMDHSPVIAKQYVETGKLKYYRGEVFVPLGAARNEAIARATGDYLAFLDCDDLWLPEKLERQVSLLDANLRCGFVYADAYRITEQGVIVGRFSDTIEFLRGDRLYDLLRENFASALSSIVIRRTALEEAGGFRPQFNICEEYDLLLRIAERYAIDYIHDPLVKYREHGSNVSKDRALRTREVLEILDYWMTRRPDLLHTHRPLVEQRRCLLHAQLAASYLSNGCFALGMQHAASALSSALYCPGPALKSLPMDIYKRLVNRALTRVAK